MDIMGTMRRRHAVRAYTDKPMSEHDRTRLDEEIARCNVEGGLSMCLVCDEPKAYESMLARYGKFSNVRNYIVLAGPDTPDLDERCGYYGERIVLLAQELGLNTCWVALSFKRRLVKKMMKNGERLALSIAIGYGKDAGKPHKIKKASEVSRVPEGAIAPDWFSRGIEAALLAPTAINQQKFEIELTGDANVDGKPLVALRSLGGPYSDVDLGIVRLHFELGAGLDSFAWENPL